MNTKSAWNRLMICLMGFWIGVLLSWFARLVNADILIALFLAGLAVIAYYMAIVLQYLYDFYDFGVEGNRLAVLGSFLNFIMIIFVFYLISWF